MAFLYLVLTITINMFTICQRFCIKYGLSFSYINNTSGQNIKFVTVIVMKVVPFSSLYNNSNIFLLFYQSYFVTGATFAIAVLMYVSILFCFQRLFYAFATSLQTCALYLKNSSLNFMVKDHRDLKFSEKKVHQDHTHSLQARQARLDLSSVVFFLI